MDKPEDIPPGGSCPGSHLFSTTAATGDHLHTRRLRNPDGVIGTAAVCDDYFTLARNSRNGAEGGSNRPFLVQRRYDDTDQLPVPLFCPVQEGENLKTEPPVPATGPARNELLHSVIKITKALIRTHGWLPNG